MSPGNVRRRREIKEAANTEENKRKKAKRKAEREAAGKKQAIGIEQFEEKVRELMKDGKSNQQAIKRILETYEIR